MRLITLGSPRLERSTAGGGDESTSQLGLGKPLALITYLAGSPRRAATRDRLCDLLWGDREIELGRAQLRQTLYLLKNQTGRQLVESSRDELRLIDAVVVDADEFRAAVEAGNHARAVTLYGGDFFSGFRSPGASEFERWADLERTRLRILFANAAEALARAHLDAGRFKQSQQVAQTLRDADPHNQVGARLNIEALIAAGDTLGARVEAEHFEAWLASEDHAAEPASTAIIRAARRSSGSTLTVVSNGDLIGELVGREAEFSTLCDAWNSVARGFQHHHVIAPSGYGKTRLVMDVATRLRASRARVIYRRAEPGDRTIAFSFAASLAAALGDISGARGVSSGAGGVLVSLNPSLSAHYSVSPDQSTGPEMLRRRGFALVELIAAVAHENPVAIIVDDLQWCDEASQQLIGLIATQLRDQPALLITTARPTPLATNLPGEPRLLSIGRLGLADIHALISSLGALPDDAWARELPGLIDDTAGGSPLHALEALRLCLDEGVLQRADNTWQCRVPELLATTLHQRAVVTRRLGALSGAQLEFMTLLAAAGMSLTLETIVRGTGATHDDTRKLSMDLERRGFVEIGDGWVRVAHDEISDAVLANAPAEHLRNAHHSIARGMAESAEPHVRRRAILHLAAAEEWPDVSRACEAVIATTPSSSRIDDVIAELLGPHTTPERVAAVKSALPFRVRRRRAVMRTLIGAVMAAIVLGAAALVRGSRDPEPDVVILATAPGPSGTEITRRVGALWSQWDPGMPIRLLASAPSEHWAHSRNDSPFGFSAGRPGTDEWVSSMVSQDSGGIEVALWTPRGTKTRLTSARGDDTPGSFSPDGKQLVILTSRWSSIGHPGLAIIDMATRSVRRLTRDTFPESGALWSVEGTRIAFERIHLDDAFDELCTIDVDGSNERCQKTDQRTLLAGWIDAGHVIVTQASRISIMAVDSMTVPDISARGSLVRVDASGRWALICNTAADGTPQWRLAPSHHLELARDVVTDVTGIQPSYWFSYPGTADYLDRIAIEHPAARIPVRTPFQLRLTGWTVSGAPVQPSVAKWTSLSPTASIDSLGILFATDTGSVVVRATAGGWRTVTDTIHVESVPARTLFAEDWSGEFAVRWKSYGDPKPMIVPGVNGARAFFNNGDGNFFSGAYTLDSLDMRDGAAIDMDLSMPLTETRWQYLHVSMVGFRDTSLLRAWDHRTAYFPVGVGEASCSFAYPSGEGRRGLSVMEPFGDIAVITGGDPLRLASGKWFHLRIQAFPDGRCGLAINGRPAGILPSIANPPAFVHLMLEGSSKGTRVLVGAVRVTTGVPADVDWTQLRFANGKWLVRQRMRRETVTVGHRH